MKTTSELAKIAGREYITPEDIRQSYLSGNQPTGLAAEVLHAISDKKVEDTSLCAHLAWKALTSRKL